MLLNLFKFCLVKFLMIIYDIFKCVLGYHLTALDASNCGSRLHEPPML